VLSLRNQSGVDVFALSVFSSHLLLRGKEKKFEIVVQKPGKLTCGGVCKTTCKSNHQKVRVLRRNGVRIMAMRLENLLFLTEQHTLERHIVRRI
jgi:hypothetical protein